MRCKTASILLVSAFLAHSEKPAASRAVSIALGDVAEALLERTFEAPLAQSSSPRRHHLHIDLDSAVVGKPGHQVSSHGLGGASIAAGSRVKPLALGSSAILRAGGTASASWPSLRRRASSLSMRAFPEDGGLAAASSAIASASAALVPTGAAGGGLSLPENAPALAGGAALVGAGGYAAARFAAYWKFEFDKAALLGRAVPKSSRQVKVLSLGQDGKMLYYLPKGTAVTMLGPEAKPGALTEVAAQAGVTLQTRTGGISKAPALAAQFGPFDAVVSTGEVSKNTDVSLAVQAALQALKPGGALVFAEPGIGVLEALKKNEDQLSGLQFDKGWAGSSLTPHSLGVASVKDAEIKEFNEDEYLEAYKPKPQGFR